MRIVLYSKPGCHLCDDARALLDELASEVEFELDEVDIRANAELFERYRYRIPVINVDGRETLEGRIGRDDLGSAVAHAPHSRS